MQQSLLFLFLLACDKIALFLKQAKEMINDLNSTLESSSADDKIVDDDDVSSPSLDPMAFQMNINNLSRKVERIEYGNELGKSAVALLQLLEEAKNPEELYHDLRNIERQARSQRILSLFINTECAGDELG